ncbi:MAG: 2-aminoethylphosphonate--pyruvate transaminase [Polyangiaceae bacterium]|nr:2-aminoethylphosphonate--pyruvate transaminase [Polyangiaceae bacterium]
MKSPLLFTPGPLTTSRSVKEAMLLDLGSRDRRFIDVVRGIRGRLLALGGAAEPEYTAVLMQGSGTFGIESVLGSAVPRAGKVLVLSNGAYGERIAEIARVLQIDVEVIATDERRPVDPAAAALALARDTKISHVAAVHCETSTGLRNPVEALGRTVREAGRSLVIDAMSSFGAVPLSLPEIGIDYLISSANKCIEGVPGFSFVLARRAALEGASGNARSLSLDLAAQARGLDGNGQFRFTPPTHAILAFNQALDELDGEGGVAGRAARYGKNCDVLTRAMKAMGFRLYLDEAFRSHIITSFYCPDHPRFSFDDFYSRLAARGFVIYPGKVSRADCFRIGTIGRIYPADVEALTAAIAEVLAEMDIPVPLAKERDQA